MQCKHVPLPSCRSTISPPWTFLWMKDKQQQYYCCSMSSLYSQWLAFTSITIVTVDQNRNNAKKNNLFEKSRVIAYIVEYANPYHSCRCWCSRWRKDQRKRLACQTVDVGLTSLWTVPWRRTRWESLAWGRGRWLRQKDCDPRRSHSCSHHCFRYQPRRYSDDLIPHLQHKKTFQLDMWCTQIIFVVAFRWGLHVKWAKIFHHFITLSNETGTCGGN